MHKENYIEDSWNRKRRKRKLFQDEANKVWKRRLGEDQRITLKKIMNWHLAKEKEVSLQDSFETKSIRLWKERLED